MVYGRFGEGTECPGSVGTSSDSIPPTDGAEGGTPSTPPPRQTVSLFIPTFLPQIQEVCRWGNGTTSAEMQGNRG